MKLLFVFIFTIFCSNLYASEFNYICNFETIYKNGKDGSWQKKTDIFIINYKRDTLTLYDKTIEMYHDDLIIIHEDEKNIIGVEYHLSESLYSEKEDFGVSGAIINIHKKDKFIQLTHLNYSGGITARSAYCD